MTTPLPPVQLAFIIDNRVVDIINTDDRLAAIFLSQPVILDVTGVTYGPETGLFINSTYNPEQGSFSAPVYDTEGNLIG